MTTIKEAREKYGCEDKYSEIIYQGHRCRNCGSKATIRVYIYPNGRKYLLCDECARELENKTEEDITTYDWDYERLVERDEKLDAKWHGYIYGGVK